MNADLLYFNGQLKKKGKKEIKSYNFVQNLFDDLKASVNKIFSRVELVKMM